LALSRASARRCARVLLASARTLFGSVDERTRRVLRRLVQPGFQIGDTRPQLVDEHSQADDLDPVRFDLVAPRRDLDAQQRVVCLELFDPLRLGHVIGLADRARTVVDTLTLRE